MLHLLQMEVRAGITLPVFLVLLFVTLGSCQRDGEILLKVKDGLDPNGEILVSWVAGNNPCSEFIGVACDSEGRVTNVSLQGRGLHGSIPEALGELTSLTALYLHYNRLKGRIPSVLGSLHGLTDIYLNVNKLSGVIPAALGSLPNLQALQLCCNELTGEIPDSLGRLQLLNLLAVQHNGLVGSIPASIGQLSSLTHLDLSFNKLNGTIPAALNNLAHITVLDIRSNQLSGSIPPGLRTLEDAFLYRNNSGLCGDGFSGVPACNVGTSGMPIQRPEPLGALSPAQAAVSPTPYERPAANVAQPRSREPGSSSSNTSAAAAATAARHTSKMSKVTIISTVVAVTVGVSLVMLLSFVWFRRHKQRISSAYEGGGDKLAIDLAGEKRRDANSFASLLHTNPRSVVPPSLALQSINAPKSLIGSSMRTFQYRLDELELATNYFSEKCLLARKSYSSIYRAVLRDGSTVIIKDFTKTRFGSVGEEFEMALSSLIQLKHENLVKLRGFCCIKGGAECYFVYDYVSNGTLFEHLHGGTASPLDWPTRVHIALCVARGLEYLHRNSEQLVIWASNILLDENYNPLISSWGMNKLVADEVVFANVKMSAMLGYLAPEYALLGHLDEKSDVYAFGMLLLEILTGRKPLYADGSSLPVSLAKYLRPMFECGKIQEMIDPCLCGKFSTTGAISIAGIAFSCISDAVEERPSMMEVVQRLYEIETTLSDVSCVDPGFSSGEDYPTRQQAAYVEMMDYGR